MVKHAALATLLLISIGCDSYDSATMEDRMPIAVDMKDPPMSCDPNIAEILVDPEAEDIYTPGECFGASECWANTYTDEIEIACYFPGCEDADVVSFTPQVVEVTLENPCAS